MQNKLNEKKPRLGKNCNISGWSDQVYAQTFQGKPVKILLRRQSIKAKELENNKIDVKLFFKKGPTIKFPTPKKIPRNNGRPIIEIGIKNLKFSSKVSEFDIQYVPVKKKPTPNKYPIKNKFSK